MGALPADRRALNRFRFGHGSLLPDLPVDPVEILHSPGDQVQRRQGCPGTFSKLSADVRIYRTNVPVYLLFWVAG